MLVDDFGLGECKRRAIHAKWLVLFGRYLMEVGDSARDEPRDLLGHGPCSTIGADSIMQGRQKFGQNIQRELAPCPFGAIGKLRVIGI